MFNMSSFNFIGHVQWCCHTDMRYEGVNVMKPDCYRGGPRMLWVAFTSKVTQTCMGSRIVP